MRGSSSAKIRFALLPAHDEVSATSLSGVPASAPGPIPRDLSFSRCGRRPSSICAGGYGSRLRAGTTDERDCLRHVVRLLAVQHALQRIEVPLCRTWTVEHAARAD